MGWVDPWVGLSWIGLGWVEIFQFLVGWVNYSKSTNNLKGFLAGFTVMTVKNMIKYTCVD